MIDIAMILKNVRESMVWVLKWRSQSMVCLLALQARRAGSSCEGMMLSMYMIVVMSIILTFARHGHVG